MILAPVVRKVEPADSCSTEKESRIFGFRAVYVFDVSQTHGAPLPTIGVAEGEPGEYFFRLEQLVHEQGIALEYSDEIAPAKGMSCGKKIILLPGMAPAEQFSTLVHELAHEMLHRDARRTQTTQRVRETEAEAVAFVVSQGIGLDTNSAAQDYISLCVGLVRKDSASGTKVRQCDPGVLGSVADRKGFKLLTRFGLKHNELFFAKDCVLLEGQENEIGVIATARKLGRIQDLPDEIGLSIVVAGSKGEIPKFQKVLNAFELSYGVLLELDGNPETHSQTAPILENLSNNRCYKVPKRLEDLLGVGKKHFDDVHHAREFSSDPTRINADMEALVRAILP